MGRRLRIPARALNFLVHILMLKGLSSPSTSFGGFVSAMPTSDTKLIRDKTEQDVVSFMRPLIIYIYKDQDWLFSFEYMDWLFSFEYMVYWFPII